MLQLGEEKWKRLLPWLELVIEHKHNKCDQELIKMNSRIFKSKDDGFRYKKNAYKSFNCSQPRNVDRSDVL